MKYSILGVGLDAVDYDQAVARVIGAAAAGEACAVSALAVHGVMTGVLDAEHRHRLNRLDLVVPDGQPVRWALNLLHELGLRDRVYGPTLMLRVCQQAAAEGLPIFLYGSTADVLEKLRKNLESRFPGLVVAGAQPSKFRKLTEDEVETACREIRSSGARLVFVGLGCPRQEVWVYENRERLGMPALAVGAAFDFHAGNQRQAPPALQARGLEWVYRLVHEPRRLWRRYLLLNPYYATLVAVQWLGLRRFELDSPRPSGELRYG